MKSEFVVLENGKEIDWIAPIVSFKENDTYWVVDNGYHIPKENRSYLTRLI